MTVLALPAAAEQTPVSAGGMLQVVLGLALVLALVAGAAWLLRRMGGVQGNAAGAIKVIGGAHVGSRERVVLLEVAGTWLVVGVAPGRVSALASLPRGELAPTAQLDAGKDGSFPAWLRQVMERRNAK